MHIHILKTHGSMPVFPILVQHLKVLSSLSCFQVCKSLLTVESLTPTDLRHPLQTYLCAWRNNLLPMPEEPSAFAHTSHTPTKPLQGTASGSSDAYISELEGVGGGKGMEEERRWENSHSLSVSFLLGLKI